MIKKLLLPFLLLLIFQTVNFAQKDVQLYGLLPGILVSADAGQTKYSFGISSEINAVSKRLEGRDFPAEVMNLNLEGALSFDPDPDINLAAGFLYRFSDPFTDRSAELRPWQQITLISRLRKYRLRNRFRVEERWISDGEGRFELDIRLRYRISADFPLQGERLDAKEFYLNFSNEFHLTPTIDRPLYFWENRTYLGIGYRLNDRQQLEPALDFRTRKLNDSGSRRNFFFSAYSGLPN